MDIPNLVLKDLDDYIRAHIYGANVEDVAFELDGEFNLGVVGAGSADGTLASGERVRVLIIDLMPGPSLSKQKFISFWEKIVGSEPEDARIIFTFGKPAPEGRVDLDKLYPLEAEHIARRGRQVRVVLSPVGWTLQTITKETTQ